MRSTRLIVVLAAMLILTPDWAISSELIDDRPEVVSEYARGKRLLRDGNYLEASRVFFQLAGRFPDSKNYDLFVFNRAKADYYFGSHSEAQAGFLNFLNRYPNSEFTPHAQFFLGNVFYLRGRLDRAVGSFTAAYDLSADPVLDRLIRESLVAAISGASEVEMSAGDFNGIRPAKRCDLIRPVSEALIERGEINSAQDILSLCGESIKVDSPELNSIDDLEIAVVLPFSGQLQGFGEDIYNGAVIAAEQFREVSGVRLQLSTYDTRGDPISAGRIVRQLVRSSADAIIGPLTSEEAAVASAALGEASLPMIAPAATQSGLTQLSRSSFQLSPNIELQGILAADFAVTEKLADSAVIITPTNPDDLLRARAFADRFEELGGTIVAIQYYRPRDKDFGKHIKDVKAAIIGQPPDSMFFIDERGDTLADDGIPAAIDCMYLPGSASQLRLLLPQINFYNLQAFYLGSDGWGDEAIYKLDDNVTRNAVFPSPFLHQQVSEEATKFSAAYDFRYGEQPQRLASLGYDAVKTIVQAFSAGASSREDLVRQLSAIKGYRGAAADLSFGEYRENVELPLYQLLDGQPVRLDSVRNSAAENID